VMQSTIGPTFCW